jgi:hypothetical protein
MTEENDGKTPYRAASENHQHLDFVVKWTRFWRTFFAVSTKLGPAALIVAAFFHEKLKGLFSSWFG